jgi:hypothetical protein
VSSAEHKNPTHLVPLAALLHDLIGNSRGLSEGGHVLPDAVERDANVLGEGTGELGLGLVADDGETAGVRGDLPLDGAGDGGVNTAAETSVGGDGEVEDLGLLGLGFLDGNVLEELCAGASVNTTREGVKRI